MSTSHVLPRPTSSVRRGSRPRGSGSGGRIGAALALVLLLAGYGLVGPHATRAATASPGYDWPQFDGNPQHSGNNTQETTLSAANVGGLQLLHRLSLPNTEDGAPAYLSGVTTSNGMQDLLFLTTSDGHILALDAHTLAQVWGRQYGPGSCHINNGSGVCYTTSSPAVDPNRQYVYSYGLDGYVHKYAADSGVEVTGGGWPELVTTKGYDEKESSALAVATAKNGVSYLYVAQAGYPGDNGDYQGHVTTISLADGSQHVFNANCSDQAVHFVEKPGAPDCAQVQTAVWSRPGVVYDGETDRLYFSTGNGPFDANGVSAPNHDWGDSVLALAPNGTGANGGPLDSYTPGNYQSLRNSDLDIGSTSPAILPVPANSSVKHLALQSGKDSKLRLLNLDNLSGQAGSGHTDGQIGSVINVPQGGEVLPTPAVWVNPSDGSTWVFVAGYNGLAGLQLTVDSNGTPSLQTRWQNTNGGTSPIIANNVLYYASYGALKALNPTSGAVLWQDTTIGSIHWESPIVANGVLYLTDGSTNSGGSLSEYALPSSPTATPAPPTAAASSTPTAAASTPTAFLPMSTSTAVPPASTSTPPPLPTATAIPPTTTATNTPVPATATKTASPSNTSVPATATSTLTPSPKAATSTSTALPPTATATRTPVPPTATSTNTAVPTSTNTAVPSTPRSTETPTAATGYGDLAPSYNNIGVSSDNNRAAASFDYGYASYSAQALQAAGLAPGSSPVFDGLTFRWPNAAPSTQDNVVARGQTIPLSPPSSGSTLAFLGAATNGPSAGLATIRYSDGSTQSFRLGFADWTLNGGWASRPAYGNKVVVTMPYRNRTNGTRQLEKTYVFYVAVALQPGKTVTGVTLPARVNRGLLHILALTVGTPIGGHRG